MLLPTVFSVLALAAIVQSVPTPTELEVRRLKYYCKTIKSGKLSGLHHDKPFSFTKSKNGVTYSGDHSKTGVLHVEFQVCTDADGKLPAYDAESFGRLRVKGTNTCIDLAKGDGYTWLPRFARCNAKELTDAQTWVYHPDGFGLFWAGFMDFGNPDDDSGEACRGGYKHSDDGKPSVKGSKQIEVTCFGDEDEDFVRFFSIL